MNPPRAEYRGAGGIMLYNESCFETFSRMDENAVDYVFTSPPYNRKRNDKYRFFDDRSMDYYGMLKTLVQESIRVAKKHVFINIMKNYYNAKDVYRLFGEFGNDIVEVFVWEKLNPLPASGKSITNSFEYIIAFGEDSIKSNSTYTKNHLSTPVAIMPKEHKAVMHEDVAFFFINNFTKPGDTVYDPFMGTGTTALVCRRLERNWVGSEISKEYCDMTEKRLAESLF